MGKEAERQDNVGEPGFVSLEVAHWVQAARSGSADALGNLLELFRAYLTAIADRELRTDLRGKLGASDIVQETLLEAQRDFEGFRGQTGPELLSWLRRILLNNLLNQRRRFAQTKKRAVGREVSQTPAQFGYQLADDPTPSQQAAGREEAALLEAAMGRLPAEYRRVIELRHREGLSFAEIGRAMERSADAARMLWYRAFEHLAAELDQPT